MLIVILHCERDPDAGKITLATCLHQTEHSTFDLFQLVNASDLSQSLPCSRIQAEHDGVRFDVNPESGGLLIEGQTVGVNGNRQATCFHVREDFSHVGNQQRFSIDAWRNHRLGCDYLIEHLPCRSEIHDPRDLVDFTLVIRTPDWTHWTAQVALRRKIYQHPLRQIRNRKRLPVK